MNVHVFVGGERLGTFYCFGKLAGECECICLDKYCKFSCVCKW